MPRYAHTRLCLYSPCIFVVSIYSTDTTLYTLRPSICTYAQFTPFVWHDRAYRSKSVKYFWISKAVIIRVLGLPAVLTNGIYNRDCIDGNITVCANSLTQLSTQTYEQLLTSSNPPHADGP